MELLLLGLLPLLAFGIFGSNDDDSSDDNGGGEGEPDTDILRGTDGSDDLQGGAGSDLILAAAGPDDVSGGAETDIVVGEGGEDTLRGDDGDDVLLGGGGTDILSGGNNDDILIGGNGDDTLLGGQGLDLLVGSSGADELQGNDGADVLIGVEPREGLDLLALSDLDANALEGALQDEFGTELSDGEVDRVIAGVESGTPSDGVPGSDADDDFMLGGRGNDILLGDRGDVMTGGEGRDAFAVLTEDGADVTSILDFDPTSETLALLIDGPATGALTFRNDAFNDGVEVLLNGDVVAYLEGVLANQIVAGSVTLQSVG